MATITPFRGWRYAPHISLDEVLAPPYDVISPAERADFGKRSRHHVVNLTLPQLPANGAHDSAYAYAAQLYAAWQGEGVLVQDANPAFYLLRQRFPLTDGIWAERLGFIGRLELRPWGEGILPHEQTFPQAKADRLALLDATGMEDNPIFLLYRDPKRQLEMRLDQARSQSPTSVYRDDQGVVHEMWVVQDADIIQALTEFMAARTLIVADGHHRYETALNYQKACHAHRRPTATPSDHDFVLAYFAAMEDPGMMILPTHRLVVRGRLPDFSALVTQLQDVFDLTPLADDAELLAAMHSARAGTPAFGLLAADQAPYLLRLRPSPELNQRLLDAHPAPVAALPVAILQTLILGPHFGIHPDPQAQKTQLQFEPDAAAAVAHVRAHRATAALLTTATSMVQLRAIAEAGVTAPPKATYFYPKLPSGMVFYDAGMETRLVADSS